jgi:hypothetical protein
MGFSALLKVGMICSPSGLICDRYELFLYVFIKTLKLNKTTSVLSGKYAGQELLVPNNAGN